MVQYMLRKITGFHVEVPCLTNCSYYLNQLFKVVPQPESQLFFIDTSLTIHFPFSIPFLPLFSNR